ncbi:MAG: cytochrome c biogenesis CcdA family protein [Anaerolineales bacterium]
MDSLTFAHLAPAFTIGLLATMNPCVLPLYPGFLAYLANNKADPGGSVRYLGLLVLAGVMTMTLALGAMIAALAEAFGELTAFVAVPGAAVMIGLGLLLLFNVNPLARLPQLATLPRRAGPYARAYLYGLLYGPMILPCCGPLVVSMFSLSLGVVGFVEQLLFLLIFGLGLGLPLLALSFVPKAWGEWLLHQVTRRSRLISRLSGLVLLLLGIWNLWGSWALLRWYFGA